jgi:hypothetical protein
MNFDDACKKCPPGYSIKSRNCGWNEHYCQYGRDQKGNLYWTAGGTVGGHLTPKDTVSARNGGTDYEIYNWGQREPATNLPTFEEASEQIRLNSVETHRNTLINKIHETVTTRMQDSITAGVDPTVAQSLVYGTTRDILGLLDTKVRFEPVYTVSRNKYAAPNLAGGLLDLFDKING